MRAIQSYREDHILFFDIETARIAPTYSDLSPEYKMAWDYKARYNNEAQRKSGIEASPDEFYNEKAALYSPFSRIVCISMGVIVGDDVRLKSLTGEEAEIFNQFNQTLEKSTAFVLGGFGIIGFDMPTIVRRMIVHGIKPHPMLDTAHLKPWEVTALDLSKLWQGTGFYPDSLQAVAVALGLPSPKDDISGADVSDCFWRGEIDRIAEYCERDVRACVGIFKRMKDLKYT